MLSRYVDAIMIRCFKHDMLLTLAEHATVPVINALTEWSHPCQIMADLQTMIERHGPLATQSVAWLGDGNNVATSWIEAAAVFGFKLNIACPDGYAPSSELLAWARAQVVDITLTDDATEAARNVQTVVTDVWISMGDDEGTRAKDLRHIRLMPTLWRWPLVMQFSCIVCQPSEVWKSRPMLLMVRSQLCLTKPKIVCMRKRRFWHGAQAVINSLFT